MVEARQGGIRFGLPVSDPVVIADKLRIVIDARAKGRAAQEAARLVGRSRSTQPEAGLKAAARSGGSAKPTPLGAMQTGMPWHPI